MMGTITDLRDFRRRRVDQRAGFRLCGWKPLRDAVTEASRAVNGLVPLHLAREEEILQVVEIIDECRELAAGMLSKGRRHGK